MKVRYTLPPLADLENILDYVTGRSPQGANRVRVRIKAVERFLAQHPMSGARTRLPWLRRITVPHYPYLIFYEVTDEAVIVHAVRHSARSPSSIPDSER